MEQGVVSEIVNLTRTPRAQGDFIAAPNDWLLIDPASLIKAGPSAKTLAVSTLGAIRDYLTANRDALALDKLALHVVSPNVVHVLGPLDARARVRETFLEAKCDDLSAAWLGRYWSLEEFLIGLQTRFVDSDDRKAILKLLSSVKHETVKSSQDDGMTQVVQAKAGVVLVTESVVPNPVTLTPFRTFRDVTQPSSLFVLRLNSGKAGGLPEAGLFEADGGAWKLTAVSRVHDWLKEAITDAAILA